MSRLRIFVRFLIRPKVFPLKLQIKGKLRVYARHFYEVHISVVFSSPVVCKFVVSLNGSSLPTAVYHLCCRTCMYNVFFEID